MSSSTHPVAPEEVMALLDGELRVDRSLFVSAHIADCSECDKTTDSVRNVSTSLAKWTVPNMPVPIEDKVLRSLSHIKNLRTNEFLLGLRRLLSLQAVLVSGAGLVILWVFFGLNSGRHYRVASKIAAERDLPVDNAAPMASSPTSRATLSERGRNPITGRDNADSQYYVHKIPFQAQPGYAQLETQQPPMIARTVLLSIVVKDFDAARASLDAILARHNGYAASLNVSTQQGSARTLQASLRIPAPQLAAALSESKALGRLENETQNGEEVTQQHADLLARLKNSRETEGRLQDVLRTRTGKVKDVLEVEQEIARVRGEIEQIEAEQKTLEHRVEFATIDLKLAEEYKAQLSTPAPSVLMQLRNAAVNGFRSAFESLLALVLFLAESGPSLLLWLALLGIPGWRLWKRYRRAQSMRSLAAA